MRNFTCQCGNTLYFESTGCLRCGRTLGYLPEHGVLSALEPESEQTWRALHPDAGDTAYRQCRNYREENVCNWMIPAADAQAYCAACRLNQTIPNLAEPKNRRLWYRIEAAKRRLLYTLDRLGLPVHGRDRDPESGLAFAFLADDEPSAEFSDDVGAYRRVMTGHRGGLITINLAEADPSSREQMRERMNEFYRTLLGHFRHESGHYYWDRLIRDTPWIEEFRARFGDERNDYEAALGRHYAEGAAADWQSHYVSAYASCHPWEDWAETWAHYLHMTDTLETAADHGFAIDGRKLAPPRAVSAKPGTPSRQQYAAAGTDFDLLVQGWIRLTLALNDLNRSMGLPDAYPFVLSDPATQKLRFVHQIVHSAVR